MNLTRDELLILLIEECSEVIHRATKALRFGWAEVQPGQELPNSARLAGEVGDLSAVTAELDDRFFGIRDGVEMIDHRKAKIAKAERVLAEVRRRTGGP